MIAGLLLDPSSQKFVRDYLLDFQDMRMSDYLNFWTQVEDFKRLQKDYLSGKAYLLFKKFLAKDAYRLIDCITEQMREELEKQLNLMIDDPTKVNIDHDFFDNVMEKVEDVMQQELFKPYFHSKFHEQYKEAIKLRNQMQKV